jgi:hypothetical protein
VIGDPSQLQALLEEVAEQPLEWRRQYIANLEKAFGREAATQIRDGLTRLWQERKTIRSDRAA